MDKHILFYDGNCGLCHNWVKFVLNFDRAKKFLFSPLQGEKLKEIMSPDEISKLPDSIVVYSKNGKIYLKADAVIFILEEMGGILKFVARLLSILPRKLNNYCYDFIARYRTFVFGSKEDLCPLMSDDQRELFLR